MAQTSYSRSFTNAYAGQLSDEGPHYIRSMQNNAGEDLEAGIFVTRTTSTGDANAERFDATGEEVIGLTVLSYARNPGDAGYTPTTGTAIQSGATFNLLTEGAIWVLFEEDMVAGDEVWARFTAATGKPAGGVRKSADTGKARIVTGARVLTGATAGNIGEIYFSAAAEFSTLHETAD